MCLLLSQNVRTKIHPKTEREPGQQTAFDETDRAMSRETIVFSHNFPGLSHLCPH